MGHQKFYEWIRQGNRRRDVLVALKQPMTAKQLENTTGYALSQVSDLLSAFAGRKLVEVLNPTSRRSRVFTLSPIGLALRRSFAPGEAPSKALPDVDWDIYGWVCFSHRSAILKALREPLQPATIKRAASRMDPTLRMSANNVRDVIKLFLEKGIVEKRFERKKSHPLYELTPLGEGLRALLIDADILVLKGGGLDHDKSKR